MTFLDAAVTLIPALTGMAVMVYDGSSEILSKFESQYCFSPQLQQFYTAKGLKMFFKANGGNHIYDFAEPLGTCLAIFKAESNWILLGPYVEEDWNEQDSRILLTKLGISEAVLPHYKTYRCNFPIIQRDFAIKTASLLAEQLDCGPKTVRTIQPKPESSGTPVVLSGVYTNASEVDRRYEWEDYFVAAVSQGNAEKAHKALKAFWTVSTGIRFISDSMPDQLTGAAINRTLIRLGAKQGGLSPVLIDSISQEYAQRMKHTASKEKLVSLTHEMTARFCDEVFKQRRSNWSSAVRRAVDYMQVNLSKAMTMPEIARASGVDRHRLSKDFIRETGKTVKQYLAMQRCEVAAELLLDSRASVQEIAAYVGYTDTNYFAKVFKVNQGVPPQVYRAVHGTFLQTE